MISKTEWTKDIENIITTIAKNKEYKFVKPKIRLYSEEDKHGFIPDFRLGRNKKEVLIEIEKITNYKHKRGNLVLLYIHLLQNQKSKFLMILNEKDKEKDLNKLKNLLLKLKMIDKKTFSRGEIIYWKSKKYIRNFITKFLEGGEGQN